MIKVPDAPDNLAACICPECPTIKNNACVKEKGGTLFCARDKSACEIKDRGCICGICPLWDKYELVNGSFCLYGIEG